MLNIIYLLHNLLTFICIEDKDKEGDAEKKEKKDESKEGGARNLWVSGLSGDTRAKDLKQLCSKHGKVCFVISIILIM